VSKQVFRSPLTVIVWWVWVLFAVGNLIDLAVQGRDHASLLAAFVILAVTAVMWVGALRPRLVADDSGLTIVNPLREYRVSWATVSAIDTTDLLRVRCEWQGESAGQVCKKAIYAWAVGSSRRRQAVERMRAERRARPRRGPSIGVFGAARDDGFATPAGAADRSATPEPGDAEKIVSVLTARVDEARVAAPEFPAAPPASTWYWPGFAVVGVCLLALVIVIVV
jgi:hypothetical protein